MSNRLMKIINRTRDVVIKRSGMLGDVVSVEPVIRALKKEGYRRVAVDAGNFSSVFENHPNISDMEDISLTSLKFDLTGCCESQLTVLRERAYLAACKTTLPDEEMLPRLFLTEREKQWGRDLLGDGEWVVIDSGYPMEVDGRPNYLSGLHDGKRINWQRAFWTAAEWRGVVHGLSDIGFKVVQIGNQKAGESIPGVAIDLRHRTTLRKLFSLINACRYFVGMESGPMHVAQAFGLEGVAIFNPANPHQALQPLGSRITPIYRCNGDQLNHAEILGAMSRLISMSTK